MDEPKESQVPAIENFQMNEVSLPIAQAPAIESHCTNSEESEAIEGVQAFDIENFCQEMMADTQTPAVENSSQENEDIQAFADVQSSAAENACMENEEVAGAATQAFDPRQFRNLGDMIRFSARVNASLPGTTSNTHASSCQEMNEQSKRFLEEALSAFDPIEELNKTIKFLQSVPSLSEGDEFEYMDALDKIFDITCNIDYANDFHKIGGFSVLKPCLESAFSFVRWRAAEVIAGLCQNNLYCQKQILEYGLLPHLLLMVETDEDFITKAKALFAVSCIVRNFEDGFKEFVDFDGFSVLLRALQVENEKLNIKCAFLISHLTQWKPGIKDDLVNMGFIEVLVNQLNNYIKASSSGHPACIEHFLNAIVDLVKDHTKGLEIARKPELQLKPLLDSIIEESDGVDDFIEEYDIARHLIGVVFFRCNVSDEER